MTPKSVTEIRVVVIRWGWLRKSYILLDYVPPAGVEALEAVIADPAGAWSYIQPQTEGMPGAYLVSVGDKTYIVQRADGKASARRAKQRGKHD